MNDVNDLAALEALMEASAAKDKAPVVKGVVLDAVEPKVDAEPKQTM